MATVSFKIEDGKLKAYRRQAKSAGLSLSEFIRRKMDGPDPKKPAKREQEYVRCEYTGAMIFKGHPDDIPLTNESVKEMLADFP
jgi:hypothetical protein